MNANSVADCRPSDGPSTLPGMVHVVDDDEAVRDSMRWLLEANGFEVRCFESAEAFLAANALREPVGCLVLDVRMPGLSGLALQDEMLRRGSTMPVIFVTGHGDVPMAVDTMKKGAADFLQKPFSDQDLIDRIQRALAADAGNRQALSQLDELRKRYASLTPREQEVLVLVTDGRANKVMAGDLGLSQRTIEIHRARVMEKMGARSVAQLVRMTLDLGIGDASATGSR